MRQEGTRRPSRATTFTTIITCLAIWLNVSVAYGQSLRALTLSYLDNYQRSDQYIKASKLDSLTVNHNAKSINVFVSGGFMEQIFTDNIVANIYRDIRSFVPDSLSSYSLQVIADNHPIEQLVPNALRKGKKDEARLWKDEYEGAAWVKNESSPLSASKGLEGNHIALWQSHGTYFKNEKEGWTWQRPHLFCTSEDLFSQTFVVPYIIPMLENAGAVVYSARERDWQNNEVIVDNDDAEIAKKQGSKSSFSQFYTPTNSRYTEKGQWKTSSIAGFAHKKSQYSFNDHPFTDGTAKYIPTTDNRNATATIEWVPDIPEKGKYAVYVSYQTMKGSTETAQYTVYHKGTATRFSVNQQMGGSTWVYLGSFDFDEGLSNQNKVVLSNYSKDNGIVSADAVRFGGGMGIVKRGAPVVVESSAKTNNSVEVATKDSTNNASWQLFPTQPTETVAEPEFIGKTSGKPKWAEAALYNSWWSGMPDTVFNHYKGANDYNSDLWARPKTVNNLAGGSVYMPNRSGRNVPLELAMAFHTDAGFSTIGEKIGTLGICSANYYNGITDAGIDRFASYDLASMLLYNLGNDLKKYKGWQIRQIWNRNYCETREPQIPSVILEMLSHQNFEDLQLGYNPQFKFDFSRSVYKTVVKYLACQHDRDYIIQPLPVRNFAITLNDNKHTAQLTWDDTDDTDEPTAKAKSYVVYTRIDDGDFDNGQEVKSNSCNIDMQPGRIYSFKVEAMNEGGKSFPSETLSAYCAPINAGTILILNAFTRLEGPAEINTGSEQGFDIDEDPGIQYGMFAGFCGRQLVFDKTNMGSEATNGTGYSSSELEGKLIMGNTFDYPVIHGRGIKAVGNHSFCSCSEEALLSGVVIPAEFAMIDVVCGVQKNFNEKTVNMLSNYISKGGRVLISGANIDRINNTFLNEKLHSRFAKTIKDKTIDNISGSNLEFDIHRHMNSESYAVPSVLALNAEDGAFPMLVYESDSTAEQRFAAIAYDGNDCKTVTMGFPLESIKSQDLCSKLMQAITNFLCKPITNQ